MVHPHMRGENVQEGIQLQHSDGTPPHAWGEYNRQSGAYYHKWYTPTCVGRIEEIFFGNFTHMVHPHMRGENTFNRVKDICHNGTPPHAWGEFFSGLSFFNNHWYTPTCVGRM